MYNVTMFIIKKFLPFKKIFHLFIFGCTGSSLLHTGFLQLWRLGAPLQLQGTILLCWLLVLWSAGSREQLWHTGSAAPQYVKSSQSRTESCVPCTGRWILNHWITREVHEEVLIQRRTFPPNPRNLKKIYSSSRTFTVSECLTFKHQAQILVFQTPRTVFSFFP